MARALPHVHCRVWQSHPRAPRSHLFRFSPILTSCREHPATCDRSSQTFSSTSMKTRSHLLRSSRPARMAACSTRIPETVNHAAELNAGDVTPERFARSHGAFRAGALPAAHVSVFRAARPISGRGASASHPRAMLLYTRHPCVPDDRMHHGSVSGRTEDTS
jgi:hypothetical protein